MTRQCELIDLNRSTFYYEAKPMGSNDVKAMKRLDEIYTDISSTYGYRFMHKQLLQDGFAIGVNKVNRLMNQMGIQAIFPRKRRLTSIKNQQHKIYPYLLRDIEITKTNQVWGGDITYILIIGGHMYLAAIIDWHSRSVLSWKLSSMMDTALVTDVFKEAIAKYGTPDVFNTDQGSQYTSFGHTNILKQHKIKISMHPKGISSLALGANGKGRSIDNIAIERFFRTLKYDEIYINEYSSISELKKGVNRYINFYNHERFHSALGYDKPMNAYFRGVEKSA